MALRFPFRTKAATAGTASPFTVVETDTAGWRTFTQSVAAGDLAHGDTVACVIVNTTALGSTAKVVEVGLYTWDNTAKTLTRTTTYQPNATPVAWGAGTKDVYVVDNPFAYLLLANNLSDVVAATARTNLGLGSAALLTAGVAASNAVQFNGSAQYPANDGSLITGLKIPQVTRVAADQVISATTVLADVTGLTFTVGAGVTLKFVLRLFVSATGTGGYKAQLNGTATATAFIARSTMMKETALQFTSSDRITALPTSQVQVNAGGTEDMYIEITGTITVNAGGTFKLQFAQNTANGTTTIRRGSTFELQIVS